MPTRSVAAVRISKSFWLTDHLGHEEPYRSLGSPGTGRAASGAHEHEHEREMTKTGADDERVPDLVVAEHGGARVRTVEPRG